MNYREKMREQLMKYPFGEYYMLKPNQPKDILRLLDEMDSADNFIKNDFFKKEQRIDQLTNNWNELENYVGGYIYLLKTNPDIVEEGQIDTLYEVLDKMKEIIGGNNER